jgi:hypothetical protein
MKQSLNHFRKSILYKRWMPPFQGVAMQSMAGGIKGIDNILYHKREGITHPFLIAIGTHAGRGRLSQEGNLIKTATKILN